jgi:3-deoxy-D-manno-octulosonic-acid transferase
VELVEAEGGYSINNYDELHALLDKLFSDNHFLKNAGTNASNYVIKNSGATNKILNMINF